MDLFNDNQIQDFVKDVEVNAQRENDKEKKHSTSFYNQRFAGARQDNTMNNDISDEFSGYMVYAKDSSNLSNLDVTGNGGSSGNNFSTKNQMRAHTDISNMKRHGADSMSSRQSQLTGRSRTSRISQLNLDPKIKALAKSNNSKMISLSQLAV